MVTIKLREYFNIQFDNNSSIEFTYDEDAKNTIIESYSVDVGGTFLTKNTTLKFGNLKPNTDYWIDMKFIVKTETALNYSINGTIYSTSDLQSKQLFTSNVNGEVKIIFSEANPADDFSLNTYSINFTEKYYEEFTPVNAKEILLYKSQKDLKNPTKTKMNYSSTFNLFLNDRLKEYLNYINIYSNYNYFFQGEIVDDGLTIFKGIVNLNKIIDNEIEVQFIEDVDNFFYNLKNKSIKEITDTTQINYSINGLSFKTALQHKDINSPYVLVHNNYGEEVFNPQQPRYLSNGISDVNDVIGIHYLPEYLSSFREYDSLFIGEYTPRVFMRYIWDKIHTDANISYTGDFFDSVDFNSMLIHNNKLWEYNKDEIEERKIKASYTDYDVELYRTWNNSLNRYDVVFSNYDSDINKKVTTLGGTFENVVANTEGINPNKSGWQKIKLKCKIKVSTEDLDYENENEYLQMQLKTFIELKWLEKNSNTQAPYPIGNAYITTKRSSHINTNPDYFEERITNANTTDVEWDVEYEIFAYLPHDATDTYELGIYLRWSFDENFYYYNFDTDAQANKLIATGTISGLEITTTPISLPAPNSISRNVIDILPDMKQSEFISLVMNLFNLRYEIKDGVVNYYTTEEYFTNGDSKNINKNVEYKSDEKELSQSFQPNILKKTYNSETGSLIKQNYTNNSNTNEVKFNVEILETKQANKTDASYVYNEPIFEHQNFSIMDFVEKYNDDKTYLSYLNINYNSRKHRIFNYFPSVLNTDIESTKFISANSVDVPNTFSLYNYDKDFYGIGTPTYNLQSKYGIINNDILTNQNQEKIKCNIHLTNKEFDDIKLNTILQFNETNYMIENLKDFNSEKLAKLEMYRFNFNNNFPYDVTSIDFNRSFIDVNPSVITNNASTFGSTYLSSEYDIDMEWFELDVSTDIVVTNSGGTTEYEYSFDGGTTWITIPTTYNINIATESGTLSFKVRLNTSVSNINELYTFTHGSVIDNLSLNGNIYYTTVISPTSIGIISTGISTSKTNVNEIDSKII